MHWTLLTPFMIEDISNPIGAEGICQERLASSSGAAAAVTAVSWQRHPLHDREDTISPAEKLHRRGTHKMGVDKKEKQSTKYIIALYKIHYKFCFYSICRTVCFTQRTISYWGLLHCTISFAGGSLRLLYLLLNHPKTGDGWLWLSVTFTLAETASDKYPASGRAS